jgi:Fe-Mn family superoxide dismutase
MLKTTIAGTAAGMAGSGHVWLVSDQDGRLAVLPTFASGTLLVRARQMSSYAKGYYGDADRAKEAEARAYQLGGAIPEPAFGTQRRNWATDATSSPTSGVGGATGSRPAPLGSRTLATGAGSGFNVATPSSVYGVSSPAVQNANEARAHNVTDKPAPLTEVGNVIWPLMCVSIHERNWVSAGFGTWGLEKWLGEFWSVLDWGKVVARHAQITAKSGKQSMLD